MSGTWPVFSRLLGYLRHYRLVFIIALVGMAVDAGSQVAFAAMMKPLLDGTFIAHDAQVIKWLPPAIIVLFLFRGVASFCYRFGMTWVGRRIVTDIRREAFSHYLALPTHAFDHSSSGKLISHLTFDAEQLSNTTNEAVTIAVRDTLTIIGLVAYMIYLSPRLSLTVLVTVPLIGAIVVVISRRFRRISKRIQRSMGRVTHVVEEVVQGQKVVKIFGGQGYEKERFDKENERNRSLNMKVVATSAVSNVIIQVTAASALAIIVWVAAADAMREQTTPGHFMSFMTAMLLILPALKKLTNVTALLQRGVAAGESLFSILDAEAESDTGTMTLDEVGGLVQFVDVDLRYERSEELVLKQISLSTDPGTITAIVGRSGSGKTSLVSLIPRFYQPAGGKILLDGVDITDLKLTDLRSHVALVSQDVVLFNDTIYNNIAYGALHGADEDAVIDAATAAHAMAFIEEMPDGLQTRVGDRGVLLSGGQRQRIAIARAILKDAPVLILDEATSALDTQSERFIQEALEQMMKDRTTFVIAHRLSTVEIADQILVLDSGQIVERGTHSELIAGGGIYADLHRMQFKT